MSRRMLWAAARSSLLLALSGALFGASAAPCLVECANGTHPDSICNNATGLCVCDNLRTCGSTGAADVVGATCGEATSDGCGGTLNCTTCSSVGVKAKCNFTTAQCECEHLTCAELSVYGSCGNLTSPGCRGGTGTVLCPCKPTDFSDPFLEAPSSKDGLFQSWSAATIGMMLGGIAFLVVLLTLATAGFSWYRHKRKEAKEDRKMWGGIELRNGSQKASTAGSREISVDDYVSALMESASATSDQNAELALERGEASETSDSSSITL